MRFILQLIKRSIWIVTILLVVAYFAVPPIAKFFVDSRYKSKFSTYMLKSDQPKPLNLNPNEKILHRALNLDTYLSILGSNIWHFPELVFDYLTTFTIYPNISHRSFGLFVDGSKAPVNKILDDLDELNITSTAIRVYVTKDYINSKEYQENLELAKKLHRSGRDVMLVLAQLYESFSGDLYGLLDQITSDFGKYVNFYQAGEAINRDKWGMINKERFSKYIMAIYQSLSINDPEAKIVGPGVIDFEWYYTVYYLNLADEFIDIQGALLYVDREGEPENSRYGFDTIKKVHLLKAINPHKPLWITEVNWPIKNTNQYKPTSSKEAVSLEKYRDYMLRYLIEILADGYVDRIYWWQLYAKGYGLIDHTTGKRYLAFDAYKKLVALISCSQLLKKENKNGKYKYLFQKENAIITILWQRDNLPPSKTPPNLRCRSFDSSKRGYVFQVGSTPIVCGDRLSLEFINKVMKK